MTTRRRVLTILAGAAAVPAFGIQANASASQWQGIALGAEARIILDHRDADVLLKQAVAEIRHLEGIFSLYQTDSQLSRLNRNGFVKAPAFEMVELLSICSGLNIRTAGAFDPTVQGLWRLYASKYAAGSKPDDPEIHDALTKTGWRHLRYSPAEILFDRPGIELTLNGIAQGYIADRVTKLLRRNGVANVLVNTGEIAAVGSAPDGDDWSVKLGTSNGRRVALHDAAIATSAPLGTTFDGGGTVGHIVDPRTGKTGGKWSQVSVIDKSAAVADGLSTAFCLMDQAEITTARKDAEVFLLA